MRQSIKHLLKNAFLYGGGQLFSKCLTFLLLPLTTAYLTSDDYGVIGQLALMGQFLSGFFTLGFGVSLSRSLSAAASDQEKEELMGTSVLVLFIHGIVLLAAGALLSPWLSWLLFGEQHYADVVVWSFFSLMIGTVLLPFQVWLRLKEKAWLVVAIAMAEVAVTLSVTVYSIVVLHLQCRGQIYGAMIGQLVSAVFLSSAYLFFASLKTKNIKKHALELIKVGSPYIFSLVGYFMLSCSGRYLCRLQCGLEETGLYFMGQNFGRLAELFVTGFVSAWSPFAYQYIHRQKEAEDVFGKVFTYYVMAAGIIVSGLFAYSRWIVHVMVDAEFAAVWKLVGVSALPYVLWGAYGISATALIFHKKGLWQVLIEVTGGLAAIALCALLCPYYGGMGASLGTFFGFLVLLTLSFWVNRKLLPVRYEVDKLIQVVIGVGVIAFLSFVPVDNLLLYTGMMTAALGIFAAGVWIHYRKENDLISLKN